MLLWFAVLAPVLVAEVFRSPMMDLRIVAFGAVLPLVELVSPVPLYLHTMVCPLLVLTVVMLGTINRRLTRRRLLGIPIGLFVHLVLDGTWRFDQLLLWPAFGFSLDGVDLPETSINLFVGILLECIALIVALWAVRRYGLRDRANLDRMIRSGQLNRSVFR